jgi:hypothetical protein
LKSFKNPLLLAAKQAIALAIGYGVACPINKNCSWATLGTMILVGAVGGAAFGRLLGPLGVWIAAAIMTLVANLPTLLSLSSFKCADNMTCMPKPTRKPKPTPSP